ncbi:hypothetical protein PanWU01x14_108310 [Parasponia andersonii]|uniref:Uncharacterized protein n=1 Tax=Parasponia andersonii TaxID=3476 RepID=A0A2P5CZW4_PARAD|nr:hypothetical protein PanWU01x14_108310 [Parasponia andersonii]
MGTTTPSLCHNARSSTNNSIEIKEPATKLPEVHENGIGGVSQGLISFFKLKKLSVNTFVPSRVSPLSAGYDLSR